MTDMLLDRRRAVAVLSGLALASVAGVPARAETVMIFFDARSAKLVPSAQKLVALIAEIAKPGTRVTLTGFCDTAEKDPDKLSQARAMAVLNALIAAKIAPSVPVTVIGKGAREPLVPTAANVAEPQNRRVQVSIDKV